MKRITTTLIALMALMMLTSTAQAQAVYRTVPDSVDTLDTFDALDAVDGGQMKRLQLMKQLDAAGMPNAIIRSNTASKTALVEPDIFKFEMISNGSGAISGLTGFNVTTPTVTGAYSADWYRDVLQAGGSSIFGLPNGMQDAGGWYFIVAGGPNIVDYNSAVGRWTRNGSLSILDGNTYEIRFTAAGGKAARPFQGQGQGLVDVPFELWYLANTPDDPSDDVRMAPVVFDDNDSDDFDFKLDHQASSASNDPYSDWIYFFMPADDSPGQAGYNAFVLVPNPNIGPEHMARVVLMNWNQLQGAGSENAMPEDGTTIRITASIPPTCTLTSIDVGPPVSFAVTVEDAGEGMAAIDVVGTTNATVDVPAFTPGDNTVIVTVTQSDPSDLDFGAVLDLTDTAGNVSSCEQAIEGLGAIHNAGNITLAIQPNSSLAAFPVLPNGVGLDAFWPADGGVDHLFTGALWVGAEVEGEKRVMDNRYGPFDWTQTPGSDITNAPGLSDQDIGVTYDDQSALSTPIGLQVQQRSFQWSDPVRDDFILFTYTFENTGLSGDLTDVFAALWLDPDIVNATTDRSGFDADRGLIYQFDDPTEGGGYLGLKVVGGALHNANAFGNGDAPCDTSDDEEKYDCMTVGPPLNPGPNDLRIMITAEPFDLAVGETHTVAIGMVLGEDLATLQANADVMDVQNIILFVESLGLNNGTENALLASLQAAQESLDNGNTNAAEGQLNAFINKVQAQRGKKITEADADLLIILAQSILDNIGSGAPAKSGESANDEELPTSYQLSQNYPNPFNPTTTITFDLPEAGHVEMVVFDVMGREVATLVEGARLAGRHDVTWQAGNLSTGVYFYRIQAGNFVQVRQMLLVK